MKELDLCADVTIASHKTLLDNLAEFNSNMLKWVEAVWINIFLERPSQDAFCLLYINFCICAAAFYIISIIFILLNYLKSDALSKAQTKYKGRSVFHIVDCCWRVCASQYRECNRILLLWRVMNYSTASAPAALHSYPWIALLKWPATPHWKENILLLQLAEI